MISSYRCKTWCVLKCLVTLSILVWWLSAGSSYTLAQCHADAWHPVSETAMCMVSARHRFLVHPQACYVAESNWRTHFWMGFGATLLFVSTENCWKNYRSKLPKVPLLVFSAATSAIDNYLCLSSILSGKLRWQWKMDPLKMYFRLNMGIFHSYVSLPESNSRQLSKALTASPNIGHGFCLGQVGAFRVESVEHGEIFFFIHGFSWKWVTPKCFPCVFSPSIIRGGRLPTHTQVLSILLAMQQTTCQRCQEDICQAVPWKDQGIKSGRNISFLIGQFQNFSQLHFRIC